MREIILPIKCSTVRNLQDPIALIVLIELHIYAIFSIFTIATIVPMTTSEQTLLGSIACFIIVGGAWSAAMCIAVDVIWLYEHLPTISCIKDETERGA